MSKKLAAKASLIQAPPTVVAGAEAPKPVAAEARQRTAPGTMAHFIVSQSTVMQEADTLRQRLKAFDGAQPVRALDPHTVQPSRWANRHASSYQEAAFAMLRAEIAAAGGNVQPIKVRPLPGATEGGEGAAYEIVYGHRRHRACLELGLPVRAVIEEMDDQRLFETMERENRARKNLSAWEQGMMYRRALDGGLYPSQRRMAEALGVDVSLVSKSLALARLPEAVVEAFATPLDIQFRWSQPLAEALQKDPDGLVTRAKAVGARKQDLSAHEVFRRLVSGTDDGVLNRSTPATPSTVGEPGRGAQIVTDARGRLTVRFDAAAMSPEREAALRQWLASFLREPD